jgi:hypothetical protein
MTADAVATLVEVRGKVPRTWQAHCPARQDPTPSLTIGAEIDGRVLLHSFVREECGRKPQVERKARIAANDLACRWEAIVGRPGAKLVCTPEADGAELPRLFEKALETCREAEADACELLRRICPNWRTGQ